MKISKKLAKMLLRLCSAMVVVYAFYKYQLKDRVWLDFNDQKIKGQIYLPEGLVKNKDCQKFFEWQESYLPEEMHAKCPWPDKASRVK